MNNTDFFRIRSLSNKPLSSRPNTRDLTPQKSKAVYSSEKKAIQSLLEGSSTSHCNTFVGYSRIPNKYDHFHEKTIPSSCVSSLLYGQSPRKFDPQKNLLLLSETLDVNHARLFFRKQLVFQDLFTVNKFSKSVIKRKKGYSKPFNIKR